MSRRAKLILIALFLVLLAVPTVYVVCTWHPVNPLRFRLVSEDILPEQDGSKVQRTLQVEVRNVSSTTVVLVFAEIFHRDADRVYDDALGNLKTSVADHTKASLITHPVLPPGGVWRGRASASWGKEESTTPADLTLHYAYWSRTKDTLVDWYGSALMRLPRSWRKDAWFPTYDRGDAPLESP